MLGETVLMSTSLLLRRLSTWSLIFLVVGGRYVGILDCKAWEWDGDCYNKRRSSSQEFDTFMRTRCVQGSIGHRSPLRQHSGMASHGGVGKGILKSVVGL